MNLHLREKICRGPSDTDEALDIAIAATADLPSPEIFEQKLASALVEILICKQLQNDPSDSTRAALTILTEIECLAAAQGLASSSATIHAPSWPTVQVAASAF
jgi:hypothetical protein